MLGQALLHHSTLNTLSLASVEARLCRSRSSSCRGRTCLCRRMRCQILSRTIWKSFLEESVFERSELRLRIRLIQIDLARVA